MTYKTQSLTAELFALRDEVGLINARSAVTWARNNPTSALHAELEWDNDVAGEEWRVHQVRRLVAIHIVDDGGARTLVSLSIDRREGGYRPIADVVQAPNLREIMLNDALTDLRRLQVKYQRLVELSKVWAATDEVEQRKGGGRRKRAA